MNKLIQPQENVLVKTMQFHKYWTSVIKKELGSDCSFCATVTHKDIVYLKVVLKNDKKGKDDVTLLLGQGVPSTLVTSKDYKDVLEILKNRSYVATS